MYPTPSPAPQQASLFPHVEARPVRPYKQTPRNSRRNLLPMKCINGSLLMSHEHLACAVIELRQGRKTPSGADCVLHHAPEAFNGIEMVPTMGG